MFIFDSFVDVKSNGGLLFPAVAMVYGRTEIDIELLESSFPAGTENQNNNVPVINEPSTRATSPRDSLDIARQNGVGKPNQKDNDGTQANDEDKHRADQTASPDSNDGAEDSIVNSPTHGDENEDNETGLSPPNAGDLESRSMVTETTAMSTSSLSDSETGDRSNALDCGVTPTGTDTRCRHPSIVRRDTYTYEITDYADHATRTNIRADTLLEEDNHLLQVIQGLCCVYLRHG